ncbi:unnamed protein product, partial [Urochloa humidicola]
MLLLDGFFIPEFFEWMRAGRVARTQFFFFCFRIWSTFVSMIWWFPFYYLFLIKIFIHRFFFSWTCNARRAWEQHSTGARVTAALYSGVRVPKDLYGERDSGSRDGNGSGRVR